MKKLELNNALIAGTDNPEGLLLLHRSRLAVRIEQSEKPKITGLYEIAMDETAPAAILHYNQELEDLYGICETHLCSLTIPEKAEPLYYRHNEKPHLYRTKKLQEEGSPVAAFNGKNGRKPVCLYPIEETELIIAVDNSVVYITNWEEITE